MFEKYMICDDGLENVTEGGKVTGFQFNARLPYYRGLGISMVENIWITVDGEAIPREKIRLRLHGRTYTLDEMEREAEDRWEFGEIATLLAEKPGGLEPGSHTIFWKVHLRISYLPFPLYGESTKQLSLSGQPVAKE